jgi:hypothetical protein
MPPPTPSTPHLHGVPVERAAGDVLVPDAHGLAEEEGAVVGDGDAAQVGEDVAALEDLGAGGLGVRGLVGWGLAGCGEDSRASAES